MESIDNVKFYEDDTYKTGVTMTVPRTTPPTPEPEPEPEPDPDPDPDPDPPEFIRTIRGIVWDDSRSEPGDAGETNTQYSGNGYFNPYKNGMTDEELKAIDKKNAYAKLNENVLRNYNNSNIDINADETLEDRDIVVRNARVDLVEIVYVEGKNGEEDRYYD